MLANYRCAVGVVAGSVSGCLMVSEGLCGCSRARSYGFRSFIFLSSFEHA